MKGTRVLAIIAGSLLITIAAEAHHSFAATYDAKREVRLEGTLVAFHFRNPHASVDVVVEDENGEQQRWGIEWGAAGQLSGQGVTRETLKAGDHVVITGNPNRNPREQRIRMLTLLRPSDGFSWGMSGETFD